MPCEQMAVIAGNPETLQESRVWVFTASWSCREHQNGRPSGSWPTQSGAEAVHIPERGEGAPFFSQREPCSGPSTQHPAPSVVSHEGNSKPLILEVPSSLLLQLSPRPFSSTLPAAPQSLTPLRAGSQESPAIVWKINVSTYCVCAGERARAVKDRAGHREGRCGGSGRDGSGVGAET